MEKTFFELPSEYCSKENSRFHIIPIPYQGTVCFKSGTEKGPDAILDVSDQVEHLDEETFRDIFQEGIHTWPALAPASVPAEEMAQIEEWVESNDFFRADRFPIFLGGEHSISAPIIRQALKRYPNLSILQFDAHSDLRDHYTTGGPYSHASVMRRVLEKTPNLVQVGIRSFSREDLEQCPEQVDRFLPPIQLEEHWTESLQQILDRLTSQVYITFDMDALDPSVAPGVGTPEPGGLTWRQATKILREVSESKNVIGADVVETMPLSSNIITEFVAARLVAKIIVYNQHR